MSLFSFPTTTLPITITVIKNDGSLWTWGYNSLGTCGILSSDYLIDLPADQAAADITNGNFIASPTKRWITQKWFCQLCSLNLSTSNSFLSHQH